jgi:hypothetical protein
MASVIWKRAQRRQNRGAPYWLDYWLKLTGSEDGARRAYNAYMCDYMRRWRKRHRQGSFRRSAAISGKSVPT